MAKKKDNLKILAWKQETIMRPSKPGDGETVLYSKWWYQ